MKIKSESLPVYFWKPMGQKYNILSSQVIHLFSRLSIITESKVEEDTDAPTSFSETDMLPTALRRLLPNFFLKFTLSQQSYF